MNTTTHKAFLNELKSLLDEEVQVCRQIERVMGEKKSVIIAGSPDALLQLDRQLLERHQKLQALEKQRIGLMVQKGIQNQSLRTFITGLAGEDAQMFTEARQQLARVSRNILELNRNNRSLLDLSLKWIRNSLEAMTGILATEGAAYNARGDRGAGTAPGEHPASVQSTVEHSA